MLDATIMASFFTLTTLKYHLQHCFTCASNVILDGCFPQVQLLYSIAYIITSLAAGLHHTTVLSPNKEGNKQHKLHIMKKSYIYNEKT